MVKSIKLREGIIKEGTFVALGILAIFEAVILSLFLVIVLLMIYKNGDIAKKPIVFGFIIAYALLLAFIAFTGLPSNFIFKRIGASVAGVFAIVALIKRKNFSFSRLMILISIILSLMIMYF